MKNRLSTFSKKQDLDKTCNKSDSTWMIEDDELHVVLAKVYQADVWACVFKGQNKLNPLEEEEVKKQLMLERFTHEVGLLAPRF